MLSPLLLSTIQWNEGAEGKKTLTEVGSLMNSLPSSALPMPSTASLSITLFSDPKASPSANARANATTSNCREQGRRGGGRHMKVE